MPRLLPLPRFRELTPSDSDPILVSRYAATADEAAFAELVRRHGPMVLGVCRRAARDTHLADDAFQATFLILARKAGAIRDPNALASWLFGVARKVATAARRREDRRARLVHRAADDVAPSDRPPAWDDLLATLDEELARLPDQYRAPLLACYLDGRTRDEAARQLGWSVSTLRRRLEAARNRLRTRMTARGATLGGGLFAGVLAPATATVPEPLARAVVESAAGGSAPTRILELAAVSGLPLLKGASAAAVLLLACGLAVGVGAGGTGSQPQPSRPAEPTQPVVKADTPIDPLPPGAVARMGDFRFRHPGGMQTLAFGLNGKVLVSAHYPAACIWDARTGQLLRTLGRRYGDETTDTVVGAVGMSADGRSMVVRADQMVGKRQSVSRSFVWDLERHVQIRAFEVTQDRDRQGFVGPDLFAPNGSRMAEIDRRANAIWLWDKDGNPTGRLAGAVGIDQRVPPVAFAPDGAVLYIAREDHQIEVWDTTTNERARSFGGGKPRPNALAVSADGKFLATFSGPAPKGGQAWQRVPEAVRIWDPAKGRLLAEYPWEKADPDGSYDLFLGVLPGGSPWAVAATSSALTFRQWDRETGRQIRTWTVSVVGPLAAVALSPDSSRLAAGSSAGVIRIFDTATGKDLTPGGGHQAEIGILRFTPDGKRLVTVAGDRTARTWDADTGKELRSLGTTDSVMVAKLSTDAATLFDAKYAFISSGQVAWNITARDLTTGRELWTVPGAFTLLPHPDGKTAWGYVPEKKHLVVVDTATGKTTRTVPIGAPPVGFGDAGRLAVAFDGKEFSGWDTATDREQVRWNPKTAGLLRDGSFKSGDRDQEYVDSVDVAAVSPDGKFISVVVGRHLWITDENASLYLCDTATGKVIWQVKSDTTFGRSVAFSPDGKSIAVAGWKARVFDTATGKEKGAFDGHRGFTATVGFSPDGTRLATGGADGTAVVWDLTRK